MKTDTLGSLQGITVSETDKLKNTISFYRKALGIQLGAEGSTQKTVDLMGMLSPQQLRGVEKFAGYLQGQEGGGDILDSLFKDITSADQLSRRLLLIANLLQELDAAEDFPGRKEARSMLASLSLNLKRIARLAAARPGRIRHFR